MFCLAINYDLIEKYFIYFHFNIWMFSYNFIYM